MRKNPAVGCKSRRANYNGAVQIEKSKIPLPRTRVLFVQHDTNLITKCKHSQSRPLTCQVLAPCDVKHLKSRLSALKVTHLHSLYFPKSQKSARFHGGHTSVKKISTTPSAKVHTPRKTHQCQSASAATLRADSQPPRLTATLSRRD